MSFKEVASLDTDSTTAIGGVNIKTGKKNPTQIEGYFLGTREVPSAMSKTGTAKIHVLQTPTGNVGVWGKTDLDRKIIAVIPGAMIRITHIGMVKVPGKRDMYKYKVEVDESNTVEVGADTTVEETPYAADDQYDPSQEETDVDADEVQPDVITPTRPTARNTIAPPDAARQAKTLATLKARQSGKTQ